MERGRATCSPSACTPRGLYSLPFVRLTVCIPALPPCEIFQENRRLKKLSDKLLHLLNRYRCAYLKSIRLVQFYEGVIARNCHDGNGEKDLIERCKRKKRQFEGILEEEIVLRKKWKNIFCSDGALRSEPLSNIPLSSKDEQGNTTLEKSSNDVVGQQGRENDNTESGNDISNSNNIPKGVIHMVEKNKSDYVSLGALDFSAYKEDSEGYVKYCEKKKTQLNNDRGSREGTGSILTKHVNQYEVKRRPLYNQSLYTKHSNVKSSQIRKLPSIGKSIYIDKYSKLNSTKKMDILSNKSVYINSSNSVHKTMGVHKKIGKSELYKSTFIPTNRHMPHLNRSIYIDTKSTNRNGNMSEGLLSTSKCALPNKDSTYKGDGPGNKKGNFLITSNMQSAGASAGPNGVYVKKTNTLNAPNGSGSTHVSRHLPSRSVYCRSNTHAGSGVGISDAATTGGASGKRGTAEESAEDCKALGSLPQLMNPPLREDTEEEGKEWKETEEELAKGGGDQGRDLGRILRNSTDACAREGGNANWEDLRFQYIPLTLDIIEQLIESREDYATSHVDALTCRSEEWKKNTNKVYDVNKEIDNKPSCKINLEQFNLNREESYLDYKGKETRQNMSISNVKKELPEGTDGRAEMKRSMNLHKNKNLIEIETNENICINSDNHFKDEIEHGDSQYMKLEREGIIKAEESSERDVSSHKMDKGNNAIDTVCGEIADRHAVNTLHNPSKGELAIRQSNNLHKIDSSHKCSGDMDDSSLSIGAQEGEPFFLSSRNTPPSVISPFQNANDGKSQMKNAFIIAERDTCTDSEVDNNQKGSEKDDIPSSGEVCDKFPTTRRKAILNINDEIRKRVQENEQKGNNLVILEESSKKSSGSKFPFPPSVQKLMSSLAEGEGEREERRINNNRANLNIEIKPNTEYVSLDIVDLDTAMNEGLHNYKKVEESYIQSEEDIRDIVLYNTLLEREKIIPCYNSNFEKKNGNTLLKNETIIFKSSQEVKSEVSKYIGMSIFQCIAETYTPSNSLMNDRRLEIWFTKRKKEKRIRNDNNNLMVSRRIPNFIFKKKECRPSCMGHFSQPITILLCSLKRRNEYRNLKTIITSIILCTCDSSTMEIILHTIPEENNKHYPLWQEALRKLDARLGGKRDDTLRALLSMTTEDEAESDEGSREGSKDGSDEGSGDGNRDDDRDDHCYPEKGGNRRNNGGRSMRRQNRYDDLSLKTYDFMKGMGRSNVYGNCLSSSMSSTGTEAAEGSASALGICREKGQGEDFTMLEDEEFCLFICTIQNVHKRFRYLLLIENFNFIYDDLVKHIRNKLNSIELIVSKHIQLKQLFCNILFLCNWMNEPIVYKWFQWNTVVKRLEKLHGYLENGRISRERCILLLLAEHTGEIFTDKELQELQKVSKFYFKDLYNKSIDFINTYLELKNKMSSDELKKGCCIMCIDEDVMSKDNFLEKVHLFVQKNYKKMLFIIWNLVLLVKKYLILIIWFGDIKPFYPLFSYMDETKKIKHSEDLFVNFSLFFEAYNKYVQIVKKNEANEQNGNKAALLSDKTSSCLPHNYFLSSIDRDGDTRRGKLDDMNNTTYPVASSATARVNDDGNCADDSAIPNAEAKKRKSLTNTVDYACEIKRKSFEKERRKSLRRVSFENKCEVQFESSD
ncbi:nuclear formin-like protein (MISFIT) [Plasmodium ovale curtisi]|uniref:Nuclear formin-like protein (MISFIT) n=1 Tax=Plasmodium ovale curtisi TaxID=864141 RepID=A0A1A8WXY4_PLAOA|nr:nuclear formin-like protein (MISFIT) [Plasmodium ovale curtisi]